MFDLIQKMIKLIEDYQIEHAAKPVTIAIDGMCGAGKSTVARTLAERLHIPYINTGAMYRAIGLCALNMGIDPMDEAAVSEMCESGMISEENYAKIVRTSQRRSIKADLPHIYGTRR